MFTQTQIDEYESFQAGQGFCLDHGFDVIEISGKDRASFLHNFCTADIKSMEAGDLVEAFVLNPKGKTIGFVLVLCQPTRVCMVLRQNQTHAIRHHLEKFVIVEDVQLATVEATEMVVQSWEESQQDQHYFSVDITAGSCLFFPPAIGNYAGGPLTDGKQVCSREVWNSIRIENGFPYGGEDVLEENLAQEFNRDKTAISFKKGCYLGQETVARLDALGHTNRSFAKIRVAGDSIVAPQTPILCSEKGQDKEVGRVTSSGWSPRFQCTLVLAVLKKPFHTEGTEVRLGAETGQVMSSLRA